MESSNNAGGKPQLDWKKELIALLKTKAARTSGLVLVGLVVLRLGVNWWIHRSSGIGAANVKVAEVQGQSFDRTLQLPGNVDAIEEATLYAHVSGYLKKLHVDEGDKVKKNQLLAVVDAPDILQEYRNAKAEYDFKETTRKRYEQLLKEQVVSQQEYDKVEAEANQSKARFDNATSNLDYTQVRAPFAGSIARRFKYPGDFISAPTRGGQPSALFLLVNEERLRVVVNVPQREVGNISIGHEVDIKVDTFPDRKFTGRVSRIDALLDEATKTQRVLVDIDNPDTRLRAGMFSSVVLHIEHKDNVPMVNRDAIHEDGDKSFIFVVRDGKAMRVQVTQGSGEGQSVEIKSASLVKGDKVVVSGGHALGDGDAVNVMEEPAVDTAKQPTSAPAAEPRKVAGEGSK